MTFDLRKDHWKRNISIFHERIWKKKDKLIIVLIENNKKELFRYYLIREMNEIEYNNFVSINSKSNRTECLIIIKERNHILINKNWCDANEINRNVNITISLLFIKIYLIKLSFWYLSSLWKKKHHLN